MQLNGLELIQFIENNNVNNNITPQNDFSEVVNEIFKNIEKETEIPTGSNSLFWRAKSKNVKESNALDNSDIHHSFYIPQKRRKENYEHIELTDSFENIISYLDLSLGEKIERNILTPKTLRLFIKLMCKENGYENLVHKLKSQAKNHEDAEKIQFFLDELKQKFKDQYIKEFNEIKSLKKESVTLFAERFLKHEKDSKNEQEINNYNQKSELFEKFCVSCEKSKGFDLINNQDKHNVGAIFRVLKSLDSPYLYLLTNENLLSNEDFENLKKAEKKSNRNNDMVKRIGEKKCIEFCKFVLERLKKSNSPKKEFNERFDNAINEWLSLNSERTKNFEKIAEIISKETFKSIDELIAEHKKHTFKRFENYFPILSNYINNILSLVGKIRDVKDAEKIINVIIKNLENACYNHDLPSSTNSHFYREVQGKSTPEESFQETIESESFCNLLSYSFNKGWIKNNFLKVEDSHTYPFPGVFSWSINKLKDIFHTNWQIMPESSKFGIDKSLFFQKDIHNITDKEILEKINEMESILVNVTDENEKQKIKTQYFFEIITCLTQLSLLQLSETEKLPHFINAELDGISEYKISEKKLSRKDDKEYKKLISTSLVEILNQLKKELLENGITNFVSPNHLIKANKIYVYRSFSTAIDRINTLMMQIDKSLVKPESINIQDILELRMLCNIYASILPAIEKIKKEEVGEKNLSIEIKHKTLNENRIQGVAEGLLWSV